jgi:hypothetical protein
MYINIIYLLHKLEVEIEILKQIRLFTSINQYFN